MTVGGVRVIPEKANTMQPIAMRGLVRRLLTQEAVEGQEAAEGQEALTLSAVRVLAKLRVLLSARIGQEGFRTLLSRALALAAARHPHLGAVRVEAAGGLAGLAEAQGADPQATTDGAEALVTHLLDLLVTFIGEDLTTRLLETAWPGLAEEKLAEDKSVEDKSVEDGVSGGEIDTP